MRGEKIHILPSTESAGGSPPHARGKANNPQAMNIPMGITPACAGKRSAIHHHERQEQDHPRMRGEKCKKFREICTIKGSPPHARGKAKI